MGRQKLIYFHYEVERQKHIIRLRQRALEAQRQADPWDGGPHGGGGPYGGGEPLPVPVADGDEDELQAA